MKHILIGAIVIALIFVLGFGVEVSAYYYETVACGPGNTGTIYGILGGDRDWVVSQWNYQGGTTWWGYSQASNGYYHSRYGYASGFNISARAYNNHPPFSNQPNKICSGIGTNSYAFAGWSSNMESQQREEYCVS